MKLHEYQSKVIFSKYGIPIPKGRIANSAEEVNQIAEELGGRVVVKAQVLIGGRGKAGGIRLAKTAEEAEELATLILAMDLKGLPVRRVLVDEMISFTQEIYLGITNDRNSHRPVMICSAAGGVDIEDVAKETPERISKSYIDPLLGYRDYQSRDIAIGIDLPKDLWKNFNDICKGLWRAYCDNDATLAEINPLVITNDHKLIALDGKVTIDDNSLFRHPDLVETRDLDADESTEIEARKYGLSYIRMDGDIGCLVNGAGLAMATMDLIESQNGHPANFLDIGGGASAEKVTAALRILLSDKKIKVVLINIYGGITRCDEVARGILSTISENGITIPFVVRLVGTNAEQGRKLLSDAHFITADTLMEASSRAVKIAEGKKHEHSDK